jgi:hypothetical protein
MPLHCSFTIDYVNYSSVTQYINFIIVDRLADPGILETLKMGSKKPDVIIIIIQMIYAGLVIVSKAAALNKEINTFVFLFLPCAR